jgi:hypothetical protein
MNEMIERVARVICALHTTNGADRDRLVDRDWEDWVLDARAAIAAMRAPTEAMMQVPVAGFVDAGEYWDAMIDAALKE